MFAALVHLHPRTWITQVTRLVLLVLVIPVSVTWYLPALWWVVLWWWRKRLHVSWYAAVWFLLMVQVATLRSESWVFWLGMGWLWESGQVLLERWYVTKRWWWTLAWGMVWSGAVLWAWDGVALPWAWRGMIVVGLAWVWFQGKGWIRNEK